MKKILSVGLLFLTVGLRVWAGQDPSPTPTGCKADLKAWGASKTETLTIAQIDERMSRMYACAEEAHHHHRSDKKVRAYLDEFYRVHTELANRTFDFITRHGLQAQFKEEENGTGNPQNRSSNGAGNP